MTIKKLLLFFLAFSFFWSLGAREASAITGALRWTYGPTNLECWGRHQTSTQFTVTPAMLDNAGHFKAKVSGYSIDAITLMYLDVTAQPSGCPWRYGEPASPPVGIQIFSVDSTNQNPSNFPTTLYDFGLLPVGSTHTISCYGVLHNNANGASGGCNFGPDPTCSLLAATPHITIGDSAKLNWTATAAFDGSINTIPVYNIPTANIDSGNMSVTPPLIPGTVTYTMTVNGAASTATCAADITIDPPSCTLSAESTVFSGESTILSWNIIGLKPATLAIIDNGIGNAAPPSGTKSTHPITSATTFTLAFTGTDNIRHSCSAAVGIGSAPAGGLVPCGRLSNNPDTVWNDTAPCNLCFGFQMLNNIITFILKVCTGVAVLIFIFAGLFYAFSANDPRGRKKASAIAQYALYGIAFIVFAWALVNIVMSAMGYISPLNQGWNMVDCSLPQ